MRKVCLLALCVVFFCVGCGNSEPDLPAYTEKASVATTEKQSEMETAKQTERKTETTERKTEQKTELSPAEKEDQKRVALIKGLFDGINAGNVDQVMSYSLAKDDFKDTTNYDNAKKGMEQSIQQMKSSAVTFDTDNIFIKSVKEVEIQNNPTKLKLDKAEYIECSIVYTQTVDGKEESGLQGVAVTVIRQDNTYKMVSISFIEG